MTYKGSCPQTANHIKARLQICFPLISRNKIASLIGRLDDGRRAYSQWNEKRLMVGGQISSMNKWENKREKKKEQEREKTCIGKEGCGSSRKILLGSVDD